jgi:SpoVK/Ycf46/Vps4 family AAA+-type ATPase
MKSINRLKDIEYYKRTGMKRKIGYLFYGPPGCGKTSHVVAMANYDNSHIIEIPMSRVKKNKEIESILNISSINGITIEKEKLIIFFDEIDQAGKALAKREGEKTEEEKENKEESNTKDLMLMSLLSSKSDNANIFDKKDDQLNLGCVLSRLDGIGNYNGLKIIAATNCKDKLSPALYRHGRLTPMFFDYCRKEDIINMIEHYYQIKLSEEQKTKIPDKSHQISPATIRKYLEDYEEDSKGLINYLHNKVK